MILIDPSKCCMATWLAETDPQNSPDRFPPKYRRKEHHDRKSPAFRMRSRWPRSKNSSPATAPSNPCSTKNDPGPSHPGSPAGNLVAWLWARLQSGAPIAVCRWRPPAEAASSQNLPNLPPVSQRAALSFACCRTQRGSFGTARWRFAGA